MKVHIGVGRRTGLAHSAVVTAANVHDKHLLHDLRHGNERRVYGDSSKVNLPGACAPGDTSASTWRVAIALPPATGLTPPKPALADGCDCAS